MSCYFRLLEDISLDQTCLCDSELNATLNIAIYLKPHSGEDELDNIAELIRNTIYNSELKSVLNISLKSLTITMMKNKLHGFISSSVCYQL